MWPGGRRGEEGLKGVGERKTVIRIYCMRKESFSNKRGEKSSNKAPRSKSLIHRTCNTHRGKGHKDQGFQVEWWLFSLYSELLKEWVPRVDKDGKKANKSQRESVCVEPTPSVGQEPQMLSGLSTKR